MTAALIVGAVFLWGCVVGAIVCYLAGARYARSLHERLQRLERPASPTLRVWMPTADEVDALNRKVFADIAAMLEDDDDEDTVTH